MPSERVYQQDTSLYLCPHRYVRVTPGTFRSVEDPSGPPLGAHAGAELFTHGQRARIGGAASPWFVVGKDPPSGTVWAAQGKDHPALYSRGAVAGELFWVDGQPPADLLEDRGGPLLFKARYGQPVAAATARLVVGGAEAAARLVPPSAFCGYAAGKAEQAAAGGGGGKGGEDGALLVLQFDEPARAVSARPLWSVVSALLSLLWGALQARPDHVRCDCLHYCPQITPGQAVVLYRGDVCLGGGVLRFSGRSCFEEGQTVVVEEPTTTTKP